MHCNDQKITARVYTFNAASIRMNERLGFLQEGRLRRMVFTYGKHADLLLFGMTWEEFATVSCGDRIDLARK